MASYQELIKNFEKVRAYMRDFYVYGFKSREDYDRKSLRSYDDERRRVESWLQEYMHFTRTAEGKTVFLSIDSRRIRHNPFYRAWKTKSFTDGDITLHFILFDILDTPEKSYSLPELLQIIEDSYMSWFDEQRLFDESTVRKKLKEYIAEGMIVKEKRGKHVVYRRNADPVLPPLEDALDFYSEIAPCGVIGSYLLDKAPPRESIFSFKHHYMTDALDSDVLACLFSAMREKRSVSLTSVGRNGVDGKRISVVPLRIFISVQNGRQHLLGYRYDMKKICTFRIDYIADVKDEAAEPRFDALREELARRMKHMWGVNLRHDSDHEELEHIEFVVRVNPDEMHIVSRLQREKRVGTVENIGEGKYRFSADVYDTTEIIPWIRTFFCRIVSFSFSNKAVEKHFIDDLKKMYEIYDVE